MRLIVFEDDQISGFGPIPTLRHVSQLRWGTKTLLESALDAAGTPEYSLWGRGVLASTTEEALGRSYNEPAKGQTLMLNARAKPSRYVKSLLSRKGNFVASTGGQVVAAKVEGRDTMPGVQKKGSFARATKNSERLEAEAGSLFEGYWDLVETNAIAIASQARRFDDQAELPSSVEKRGPSTNVMVSGDAEVEAHVTLDGRLGPIVVEPGASVESFSRLVGPCYVGGKTKLLSALIGGGTSIFEGCKVGGQVENSIIMAHTNKAHLGYVGDSYVGEWVNLGAGSNFSNLKNTYGTVKVTVGGKRVDSGALKLGPVLGDMTKLAIGALVYSGKVLGTGCHVAGLAKSNVPSFSYLGDSGELVELLLDSVVETQRRMMERRGRVLSRAEESLIRQAFESTAGERREAGVKKGRIG